MRKIVVFDIETDGLLWEVSKVHCLSYKIVEIDENGDMINLGKDINTIFSEEKIQAFFQRQDLIFCGHNIIMYDLAVIKKLWGISIPHNKCIDTLALSWYLYPKEKNENGYLVNKQSHGLETWGNYYKVPKVKIREDQWKGEGEEFLRLMKERCSRDVAINELLWKDQRDYLLSLYNNPKRSWKLIHYLSFILDCMREQQEYPLKLDIEGIKKNLSLLNSLWEEKKEALEAVMPSIPTYKDKVAKDIIVIDADARPTKYCPREDMIEFSRLLAEGYSITSKTKIKILKGYNPPNAGSSKQIKDFLFSLGWKPLWYKKSEKKIKGAPTGIFKDVPQIASEDEEGEICQSIKDLFPLCPELANLEGMGIIKHRIGLLEGLLRDQCPDKPGYIIASLRGLTNTLRIKHSTIANLPGKGKAYWEMVRGAIICEEDELICGSDISGLEDNTKRHLIYKYDPEYVKEQMTPGFDAHLNIAVLSGLMTEEESSLFKTLKKKEDKTPEESKLFEELEITRHKAKTTNFSSTYGAGPQKIADTAKISLKEAKKLHKTYWDKNWAIKKVAENAVLKEINGQLWLYNEVSTLWYSIRSKKDVFSTYNQGLGSFVFNTWLKYIRKKGIKVSLQYHDECLTKFSHLIHSKDYIKKCIEDAMKDVNKELNLNIEIKCDTQFGKRYSDCH